MFLNQKWRMKTLSFTVDQEKGQRRLWEVFKNLALKSRFIILITYQGWRIPTFIWKRFNLWIPVINNINNKMAIIVQKGAFSIYNYYYYTFLLFCFRASNFVGGWSEWEFYLKHKPKSIQRIISKEHWRNSRDCLTRTNYKNHFEEISHHAGCCS